jgi:hypothetical protein
MSPVIALRDSRPVLAIATTGSGLVPEIVRLATGVLAQKTDLRTLMEAPPMLANIDPAGGPLWDWREVVPAGAYDENTRQAIEDLGVHLKEDTAISQNLRGTAVVAMIDQVTGAPETVEVPRVISFAEADRPAVIEQPNQVKLPPSVLDRYVGDYDIGLNVHICVYRKGDRLFSKATDRRVVEIFPSSETTFFEKVENVQVTYQFGDQHQVRQAILHLANGAQVTAVRRRPLGQDSIQLRKYNCLPHAG